jgi:guanine nucleotide-binding protein G(I)/G(S)/G(T) subunit beta-1
MSCAFEDGQDNFICSGGLDNICSLYATEEPEEDEDRSVLKEFSSHDGYVSCVRFVDDHCMISSSGDATCLAWDVETGTVKERFVDHTGDVMSVSVNPMDNNLFVSGSCDNTTKVWDIRNGQCTHSFEGHTQDVNSVQFLPSGTAVTTGSDDSTSRLFDLRAYAQINHFHDNKILCGITSVAVSKYAFCVVIPCFTLTSRSGRLVFAGYDDHNCFVWDTLSPTIGEALWQIPNPHDNRISCVGVPKNGTVLCTGSWDTFLKIWA